MEYEKDYIMRLAKEIARLLAYLITGKKEEDTFGDKSLSSSFSDLYELLIKLANSGKINEAENLLYNRLDTNDIEQVNIAIAFYEHINGFTDEFLKQCAYTRDEIIQGLYDLAKIYGISHQVLTLLINID